MQSSDNGTIWYDVKQVKFCANCGDKVGYCHNLTLLIIFKIKFLKSKTLICPHKLSLSEAVIKVPVNTQFLKFSRPKLQYNQFMVKRAVDAYKKQILKIPDADIQAGESVNMLTNYMVNYPANYYNNAETSEVIKMLNEGNEALGMPHSFQRLWYDYSQRTVFKRQVQRPFALVILILIKVVALFFFCLKLCF